MIKIHRSFPPPTDNVTYIIYVGDWWVRNERKWLHCDFFLYLQLPVGCWLVKVMIWYWVLLECIFISSDRLCDSYLTGVLPVGPQKYFYGLAEIGICEQLAFFRGVRIWQTRDKLFSKWAACWGFVIRKSWLCLVIWSHEAIKRHLVAVFYG